ncbi:MAG: DUF1343 domain-containing protein [Planctomycetales bacterium]|nr:DUF1343 domain-containing protein [Planctomycetales bacterium]
MKQPRVETGLRRLLSEVNEHDLGIFGVLANQASIDVDFRYAHAALADAYGEQLRVVFSPQHGMWGEEQANMIETPHSVDPVTGLRLVSLYSETRRPTAQMLQGLETLVIDLQDVGTRVYTYVWTLVNCLQACAEYQVRVVVLDRPNPLGGETIEGPRLEPKYTSFVGLACIPMRHGLTMGELALYCNRELKLGADLQVIMMRGWRRSMDFRDTELPWVAPSPNMPRLDTAFVYPGQVLLEGTFISEGRGTTTPFEIIGAPFIDPIELAREAREPLAECGVELRPIFFRPTFDKYQAQRCGGVAWHVRDRQRLRSYRATIELLAAIRRLHPQEPLFTPPPYEYEWEKPPIDILSGCDTLRSALSAAELNVSCKSEFLRPLWQVDADAWWQEVQSSLLYD